MKRPAKRPTNPAEVRRQAEKIAHERTVQASSDPAGQSYGDARRLVHELQIHQIELEMQNDELRRTQLELETAWARYFDLYDLAPVGYVTVSQKGLILEANLTAAALLGVARSTLIKRPMTRFIRPEDQDVYYLHHHRHAQTGEAQACELQMVRPDEATLWVHLATTTATDSDGTAVARIVLTDITERKVQEHERGLIARLRALVNLESSLRDRMSDLTLTLQAWSGCEAVGIRLVQGDEYPLYETRGFPPVFLDRETRLCHHEANGDIRRDGLGDPLRECICANILCGRFATGHSFSTPQGSFWTNSTTALLAGCREVAGPAPMRNCCHAEGYQSVALVPLRTGQKILGLLQVNDHRPQRFTAARIAQFERVAEALALALAQRQAILQLRESEYKYRTLVETTETGFVILEAQGRVIDANNEYVRLAGRGDLRHLAGKPVTAWTAPHDLDRLTTALTQCLREGRLRNLVIDLIDEVGRITPVAINATVNGGGDSLRIMALVRAVAPPAAPPPAPASLPSPASPPPPAGVE